MFAFLKNNKYFIILSLIFWVFVLIKTPITSNEDFLLNYPYFTSDSLQWVSDGINIFNSEELAFRNPGLVFLIRFLHSINFLNLLPLLNQFVLYLLLISIYKTTIKLANRRFSTLFIGIAFFSFTLQNFSNYILSDLYATTFIALFLLLIIEKKRILALIPLILSMYFQNFAYFIFAATILIYLIRLYKEQLEVLDVIRRRFIGLLIVGLTILPLALFHLYKFILFGNPLYTSVIQFELINPNLDSFFYYGVNLTSMLGLFGVALPILLVVYILKLKKKINNSVLILILYYFFAFIFWFIFYDWNDKRFILYIVPAFFTLTAFICYKFSHRLKFKYFSFVIILTFLPSFFNLGSYSVDNIISFGFINVTFESYRQSDKFKQYNIKFPPLPSKTQHKPYILSILQGDHLKDRNKFKGWYLDVRKYYNPELQLLCLPKPENYTNYALGSIVMIITGQRIETLRENCPSTE